MAIAMGAVVALAILINTMSMNILEREGEFATLMSLGYGRPALSGMVLTEVLAMGIAALALAVPIAVGIAILMNAELGRVWFRIDTVVTMRDLLASLLPPFLLFPLAALPALRHVFTLDIASVVRQRAIE
jgi:ABC-type antimicrobial peptide transport system permease subunit